MQYIDLTSNYIFQMDEVKAAKVEKQQSHQLNRVKALKKEIRREDKEQSEETLIRQVKKQANDVRPGKFGPKKLLVSSL